MCRFVAKTCKTVDRVVEHLFIHIIHSLFLADAGRVVYTLFNVGRKPNAKCWVVLFVVIVVARFPSPSCCLTLEDVLS